MQAWLQTLWQDLRFGARMLRKNPGFSLAAIVTLALGIGVNTAIFTVTSAMLLKPLPYQDSRDLVLLGTQRKGNSDGGGPGAISLNRYEQIRDHNHSFSGVAVFAQDSFNLTGRGEPQQVLAARVSANFFALLGVVPQVGRSFADAEGQTEGKLVVMISDSLWRTRFGGDRQVVGQTINLDSTPYTIIGVLPAGTPFPFLGPADVWTSRYFEHTLMPTQRLRMGVGYLTVVARLRPSSTIKSAAAEMDVLNQQYIQENPKAPDGGPAVSMVTGNLQELTVANLRMELLVLSGAVGLVLLIACANVASLLLSRALVRRKEIAVRAALGAARSVIVRQLLTESVLLAAIAGVLGVALGQAFTQLLVTLGQSNLPQGFPIGMDVRVLLFALTISMLTGLAFGIFPALQLSRTDVNSTLRDEGRSTGGRGGTRLKGLLVIGQVTVTLLLLIGAGLLGRSFGRLLNVDPGFDPQNVLTMNVSLPTVKYADAQKQIAFFDELLRRVSALPGVRSAAVSAALPLFPKRITPVLPEGQPEVPLAERPFIIIEATSPKLLETLRIPVRGGRAFTDADNAQAPKVIIVNEALARRYWPGQNAVGKHILIGRQPAPAEIVGVATDARNNGLATEAQPQIYLPFPQIPWGNMNLLVRTAADPHNMISTIRGQVTSLDPDQPVTGVLTVDELMDGSRAQPRFTMLLLGAFSVVALVLAVVGIYGVLTYSVTQRWQELGIRLALGAKRSDILRLVLGQGLGLTLAGIALGLVTAFASTRVMGSLLYHVGIHDLTTFALAPLVFLVIALVASYLPARKAMRVDPTEALKHG